MLDVSSWLGTPLPNINKLFSVEPGVEYALDWTSHPRLVPRSAAVLYAKDHPDLVVWLGVERVRVIFPDRARTIIRVPAFQKHECKDGDEASIPGRSVQAPIRKPKLQRRGKANGLDSAVDDMLRGFLDFEVAWIPRQRLTVGVAQDAVDETTGRAIFYLPNA